MRILHPPVMLRRNHHRMPRQLRQTPPLRPHQRDRLQPMLIPPLERLHQIRRIPTHTHRKQHIPRPREILQLPHKNLIERIIVPQRRHPRPIIVNRHAPKPPRQLIRSALPKVRHKMRRIRRAPPVPENKNLPILLPRHPQQLHQLRHRPRWNRIQRRLLFRNIMTNPILHRPIMPTAPAFSSAWYK